MVFGLLFTGVLVAFILPAATSKWAFTIESFVVGIVEGICLVATPALIRDFSPQVGRATAMGFWTSGPVLGSLIVAVVGSATIPAVVHDPRFWTHEYRICGIAGLVVFVIALVGLRELSPQLRDQLMVTMRDRALIEARAKGITRRHRGGAAPPVPPAAQARHGGLRHRRVDDAAHLLHGRRVQRDLPDHRVRVLGQGRQRAGQLELGLQRHRGDPDRGHLRPVPGAEAVHGDRRSAGRGDDVVYLEQAGRHPSYYTLAIMLAVLSFCLGIAYTPWMASFTETVEARNPALIATGLAIWGWIVRIVVFLSFLIIPVVINSVTPLVNYGSTVSAYATQYQSQIAFARRTRRRGGRPEGPRGVATAQSIPPKVLATAQKIPPRSWPPRRRTPRSSRTRRSSRPSSR